MTPFSRSVKFKVKSPNLWLITGLFWDMKGQIDEENFQKSNCEAVEKQHMEKTMGEIEPPQTSHLEISMQYPQTLEILRIHFRITSLRYLPKHVHLRSLCLKKNYFRKGKVSSLKICRDTHMKTNELPTPERKWRRCEANTY